MKIVYISYYFPPDLGAGSFRSDVLVQKLINKLEKSDELHVITSEPNRYFKNKHYFQNRFKNKNLIIHRISVFDHKEKFIIKSLVGIKYFLDGQIKIFKINPDFIIASSARLVSGLLAYVSSIVLKIKYALDLRDLFGSFINEYSKKNYILKVIAFLILKAEKKVIENANTVNLVSPGFQLYLRKKNIKIKNVSYFTNGIDNLFLNNFRKKKFQTKKKLTLTYAGNVGYGQKLDVILPYVANSNPNLNILIIGDGGRINNLRFLIKKYKLKNIKIHKPVSRNKLNFYYNKSDILFLTLNNLETFKYTIPSKVFEYAVKNKFVLAGLSGFSKKFCKKNFNNFYFFKPGNLAECNSLISKIKSFKIKKNNNLERFKRENIMEEYSKKLIKIINNNR